MLDRKDKRLLQKVYKGYECPKCGKHDFYVNVKKETLNCIGCNTKVISLTDIVINFQLRLAGAVK